MFRGIREYTPEDPMNRINWKASARSGSLMVNQHNSAVSGNVCILLDVEDETVWKYEEIHEEGIRLAAAVAESFLSRGIEVGLITNGRDCREKSEIFLPGQSDLSSRTVRQGPERKVPSVSCQDRSGREEPEVL